MPLSDGVDTGARTCHGQIQIATEGTHVAGLAGGWPAFQAPGNAGSKTRRQPPIGLPPGPPEDRGHCIPAPSLPSALKQAIHLPLIHRQGRKVRWMPCNKGDLLPKEPVKGIFSEGDPARKRRELDHRAGKHVVMPLFATHTIRPVARQPDTRASKQALPAATPPVACTH